LNKRRRRREEKERKKRRSWKGGIKCKKERRKK